MPEGYIGQSIKYANTRNDAISLLGKHDKKLNVVIDRRGSVLTILDNEESK
jgi:hypothetical protein